MTPFEIFLDSFILLISERTGYSTRYDSEEGMQVIDGDGKIKLTISMDDLHRFDDRFLHDRPSLVFNSVEWMDIK